jgi:hypothetical protein
MRTRTLLAAASAAAFFLGACAEVAQEPGKAYAGKSDAKPYSGDQFKGDKAKWEQSLASRADAQNEYLRTGDAKK